MMRSLPKRTSQKPELKPVEVGLLHVVTLPPTGTLNHWSRHTGKRKADAEADPKREKKKSREVSEPLEESEPEPGKDVSVLSVYPVCLLSTPH